MEAVRVQRPHGPGVLVVEETSRLSGGGKTSNQVVQVGGSIRRIFVGWRDMRRRAADIGASLTATQIR